MDRVWANWKECMTQISISLFQGNGMGPFVEDSIKASFGRCLMKLCVHLKN
ncbi:hypothetical protein QJS10_CPB18g00279 [Acorus calamus]|uniref:Uncharacterized protein n=1 Tax=Acorus calamus TaxID=4465 RepID=A0AAV9CNM3_ACOCL|nr:hypothetical protein QJS10_CPB18g00279 [Acorus calamus]